DPALETVGQELVVHGHGDVNVRVAEGADVVKFLRHHPDHRVILVIDLDRLADDLAIASELAVPQRVADHRYGVRAGGAVLVRAKPASQSRLHPDHVEEVSDLILRSPPNWRFHNA